MWPAEPKVWTVAEATGRIEDAIAADPVLQSILIRGEISNYKRHISGHTYFTLKDAKARLRCVLFRRYGQAVSFPLRDGLEVVAAGRIGVYPPNGDYQLYVEQVFPAGRGTPPFCLSAAEGETGHRGLVRSGAETSFAGFSPSSRSDHVPARGCPARHRHRRSPPQSQDRYYRRPGHRPRQ